MATTLLLDTTNWDLVLNSSGDIALATEPYSQAQDGASAIRLFQGELYYDTTKGIPYWTQILGLAPPLSLLKAKFVAAALTVPGVSTAVCYISSVIGRKLSGQVQITTSSGQSQTVAF